MVEILVNKIKYITLIILVCPSTYQNISVDCMEGFNPTAFRMAKTLWSFGRSECNMVKGQT